MFNTFMIPSCTGLDSADGNTEIAKVMTDLARLSGKQRLCMFGDLERRCKPVGLFIFRKMSL
jgi:hypothetical protein